MKKRPKPTRGPYWKGQQPNGEGSCRHYYPDVLVAGVARRVEGFVVVADCLDCGRWETPICQQAYMEHVVDRERDGQPLLIEPGKATFELRVRLLEELMADLEPAERL